MRGSYIRPVYNSDRLFNIFNYIIMSTAVFACVYPFYYCIIHSFNDGNDALKGFLYIWPRVPTLENYKVIFSDMTIPLAFIMTVLRTVFGTALGVFLASMFAYSLIRKQLRLRRLYITIGLISMYFSGGLIPYYILIQKLNLINSFLVYIIPNLFGFYSIILLMAFFKDTQVSMIEAAKIDGAGEFAVFTRIVLPTSTAILATITMFMAIWHWNNWFDGYIFISNIKLKTLALILVEMINKSLAIQKLRDSGRSLILAQMSGPTENSVRLATMIVSIVPIMILYPFLQKYFVKGIMLGVVKG